jgi:RNA polymerase sigma factor (sigma-70 family)
VCVVTASEPTVALDELLAHRVWVRALARALARDEHEAADVEQATWLAAMTRPPASHSSLRGWLATTTRHAFARLRRGERRRAEHEAAAPLRQDAEDAAELAARADMHRRLVEALVALDEPYRRTLLLRWFEARPVAEVAARTGVPLETCRARLRRGMERLREQLERDSGGREAFLGALALLSDGERAGGEAAAPGGMAMAVGTKAAAFAAALLVAGVAVWAVAVGTPEPRVDATEAADAARSPFPRETSAPRPRARVEAEETTAPARDPDPPTEMPRQRPSSAPPPPAISARARLATAAITFESKDVTTLVRLLGEVSAATGVDIVAPPEVVDGNARLMCTFVQTPALDVLQFLCTATGHEFRVEAARVVVAKRGDSPDDTALVPVPLPRPVEETSYTFVVVDEAGLPVADATILTAHDAVECGRTAPDGRARLVARLGLPRVFARAAGHVDSAAVAPGVADTTLRLRGRASRLRGRVADTRGVAVVGAVLAVRGKLPDAREIVTDADGRFDDRHCPPGRLVVAVAAPGFARAQHTVSAAAGEETAVDLALAAESVIRGVVRDAAGAVIRGHVAVREGQRCVRTLTSEADGSFRVGELAPGRYRIEVTGTDGATAEEAADVGAAATVTVDVRLGAPPVR